jgi:hypothetical protein
MNEVGTVDAGFIQVKVRTVGHRIGLFIVSQRDAAFFFTLLPPAADLFSGLLRNACDGEFIGPGFADTVDTGSMQVKVSSVDDRLELVCQQ